MELINHVIAIVSVDPIFIWLAIGLVFCLIALVLARIPRQAPHRDRSNNDRYLPSRAISTVVERHNKYDWE